MTIIGKKILITGASDGVGKAIALRLSQEKTQLLLLGRNEERLGEVKAEALSNGAAAVETYAFDLSDKNTATDHLEKIRDENPDLSIIINNAGMWQKLGDIDQISHDEVEKVIGTNLTGAIKVTNTLLPLLRKQVEAAVVNIASRSGYVASSGQALYAATKFGLRGFTQSLREDLIETNIRVAGVYPGGINTDMYKKAGEDWSEERMNKYILPEELAEVVVFMLSRPQKLWIPEVRLEYR